MLFDSVFRPDADPPRFERGSPVPVATYLLVLGVLSALVAAYPSGSPPPMVGMGWGVFLVALVVGAFRVEGVSPRRMLPSRRTVGPVLVTLVAFWALYNLVAVGLALGGVSGVETEWSRVAARPLAYLAALLSSFLFTAIPEEVLFRVYLQQKFVSLVGDGTRRAVVSGVVVTAVLFALFHLPRWFLASGHGVDGALATRLLGLVLAGLAYGVVYAVTGNLWLVALFHATMNYPPVLVTTSLPAGLHLLVGVVEFTGVVSVVYLAARVTDPDGSAPVWARRTGSSPASE